MEDSDYCDERGSTNIEYMLHLLAPNTSVRTWSPITAISLLSFIFNIFFALLNPNFNGFFAK